MCGEKIEREPGKRGAPPAHCKTCEPLAKREYMRDYMREYRSDGRRVHPPAAAGGVEVERLDGDAPA